MNGSLLFSCIGACALAMSVTLLGQGRLDPAKLLKAPTDSWPTFNGDYSGRRFSPLTRITSANVHQLSLAWMFRITGTGLGAIKSTPLQINGVLYFTVPDHVWAVDGRSGRELWHYQWQTTGGNHLGNRGVAVYEDSLYFETPDCFLISLNLNDGKERWRRQICDIDRFYYASVAPTVLKDRLIVGVSGDDFDIPGYIQFYNKGIEPLSFIVLDINIPGIFYNVCIGDQIAFAVNEESGTT